MMTIRIYEPTDGGSLRLHGEPAYESFSGPATTDNLIPAITSMDDDYITIELDGVFYDVRKLAASPLGA